MPEYIDKDVAANLCELRPSPEPHELADAIRALKPDPLVALRLAYADACESEQDHALEWYEDDERPGWLEKCIDLAHVRMEAHEALRAAREKRDG